MFIISLILSGLALLAVAAVIVFVLAEKKRSLKRNAALMDYVDQELKAVITAVKKLEEGVVPNYEHAKAAADAVNDCNKGISAILGFDPYSALQAEKTRERMGGEVTDG
jgi:hypothetical protein